MCGGCVVLPNGCLCLAGAIIVVVGTIQTASGIIFTFFVPIFKLGSNLWTGFANMALGTILCVLATRGHLEKWKLKTNAAVATLVALLNLGNILLLELVEWRHVDEAEDVESSIFKNSFLHILAYTSTTISTVLAFLVAVLDAEYVACLLATHKKPVFRSDIKKTKIASSSKSLTNEFKKESHTSTPFKIFGKSPARESITVPSDFFGWVFSPASASGSNRPKNINVTLKEKGVKDAETQVENGIKGIYGMDDSNEDMVTPRPWEDAPNTPWDTTSQKFLGNVSTFQPDGSNWTLGAKTLDRTSNQKEALKMKEGLSDLTLNFAQMTFNETNEHPDKPLFQNRSKSQMLAYDTSPNQISTEYNTCTIEFQAKLREKLQLSQDNGPHKNMTLHHKTEQQPTSHMLNTSITPLHFDVEKLAAAKKLATVFCGKQSQMQELIKIKNGHSQTNSETQDMDSKFQRSDAPSARFQDETTLIMSPSQSKVKTNLNITCKSEDPKVSVMAHSDPDGLARLSRLELMARQWRQEAQHKELHRKASQRLELARSTNG